MSLKDYYEKELSALHEEAVLFAKQYPEQASALNLEKTKAHDPHVERLLEGCAFLTAKIHQMIEEEDHHLPEQLIQRLWPQLSEGFPSVCMVQADPQPGMQKPLHLPRGSSLQSPVLGEENTVCRFHTSFPMNIVPISLIEVAHSRQQRESLSFTFQASGKNHWENFAIDSIPIYIDSHVSKADIILHFLFDSSLEIKVFAESHEIVSNNLSLKFPGFEPDYCLRSQSQSGLYAEQLLFEAFVYPEKLQCFEIAGLRSLIIPDGTRHMKVCISSPSLLNHSHSFSKDDFRLFTVPAINQYEHDCEPIRLDHKHHRYALTADHHRPNSVAVLSVLSARGLAELNHEQIIYKPLSQVTDPASFNYVYHSNGYLSFNAALNKNQTISVRAHVSNVHLPRRFLRSEMLCSSNKSLDPVVRLTNINQPSAYLEPEFADKQKYLLKLLRVQVEHLRTVEHLKMLLTLMNRASLESITLKINSLTSLKLVKRSLIKQGVFYHVHGINLSVNEDGFPSISDLYVFGRLLHSFFQSSASLTTVIETTLICRPSEKIFTWLGAHERFS